MQPLPVPIHLLPAYDQDAVNQILGEDWSGDDEDAGEETDEGESVTVFKKELRRITPWKMRDLTIGSWVHLARKLVAEKKMWKQFSEFM